MKIFEALGDDRNRDNKSYYKSLWDLGVAMYAEKASDLVKYILSNCERNNVVVMNSDKEVNAADNRTGTQSSRPLYRE